MTFKETFWNCLDSARQSCSLEELRGKRVVIDSNGWITPSTDLNKTRKGNDHQAPLDIQAISWQLYHLARNQVRVVVVFENSAQQKKSSLRRGKDDEGLSSDWHEQCKYFLEKFGIPFIVTAENCAAEVCACLQQDDKVNGIISDNPEVLLFGASDVYRHFNCDDETVGCIHYYSMKMFCDELPLDRKQLICVYLLLACNSLNSDVTRKRVIAMIQSWTTDVDPIQKIKCWKNNKLLSDLAGSQKPEHCKCCNHDGNTLSHKKSGCPRCKTDIGCRKTVLPNNNNGDACMCDWHKRIAEHKMTEFELEVMGSLTKDKSSCRVEAFEHYLNPTSTSCTLEWQRPSYSELQNFAYQKTIKLPAEKLLTLITAYDMFDLSNGHSGDAYPEGVSRPDTILKKRRLKGEEVYDVKWKLIVGVKHKAGEKYITTEFKNVFCAAYPQVAALFEEWKVEKPSPPTPVCNARKRRADNTPTLGQRRTMKDYYSARKKLNFGAMPAKPIDRSCDSPELIVHPDCL